MTQLSSFLSVSSLFVVISALFNPAYSNQRRFAYVYESSVLPSGGREIETWNTFRFGKNTFFRALDQRIEYEFGVGRKFMTSLYFNFSNSYSASPISGLGESESDFSVSNEWKWKFMDRAADPVGLALYGEATLGVRERELEGKLILDKQEGRFLFAFNGVFDHEWETNVDQSGASESEENSLEGVFGVAVFITGRFSAGAEGSADAVIEGARTSHAALFLGPVLSYSSDSWWVTASWNPQLRSLRGVGALDVDEFERNRFRVLLSFSL